MYLMKTTEKFIYIIDKTHKKEVLLSPYSLTNLLLKHNKKNYLLIKFTLLFLIK